MIAQSIRSVTVSNHLQRSANVRKDTPSFSFDNMISHNLKADDQLDNHMTSKLQKKNQKDPIKYLNEDVNVQKDVSKAEHQLKSQNSAKVVATNNQSSESTEVGSQLAAKLKELKETVKKVLNLTDEELETAMETLGLTVIDLLNSNNLKQLVLTVHGTDDITEVLTNENLANEMELVLAAVKEFQEANGLLLNAIQLNDLTEAGQVNELASGQPMIVDEKSSADPDGIRVSEDPITSEPDVVSKNQVANDKTANDSTTVHRLNEEESDGITSYQNLSTEENQDSSKLMNESGVGNDLISGQTEESVEEKDFKFDPLNNMNAFIHNLAVATLGEEYTGAEQITEVSIHDIASQILEQLKVIVKPDMTTMELQLNPEHLGKVELTIVSKDGLMTAQFTTQNEMAKEAIESQIQVLLDNLNNQGLKVESIEVAVSNFTFGESNHTSKGEEQHGDSHNRNHFRSDEEILGGLEPVSELSNIPSDLLEQNGNLIDYSA